MIHTKLEKLINSASEFTRKHKHLPEEIRSFESKYKLQLPVEYINFLLEVGSFYYDYGCYGSKFTFLNLDEVEERSEEVFLTYESIFPHIVIIAHTTSGEEFGFIKGSNHLYIFDPECPCDLWCEEQLAEYKFSEWLVLLANSKMQTTW